MVETGWRWWRCRWRWIPSLPPEDSRKKDQPLNKGPMKNPRRKKNTFFADPDPEDTCKFLAGPRNNPSETSLTRWFKVAFWFHFFGGHSPSLKPTAKSPWKWMFGILNTCSLLGRLGLFSVAFAVSFRECNHLKGHVWTIPKRSPRIARQETFLCLSTCDLDMENLTAQAEHCKVDLFASLSGTPSWSQEKIYNKFKAIPFQLEILFKKHRFRILDL